MVLLLYLNKIRKIKNLNKIIQVGDFSIIMILHQVLVDKIKKKIIFGPLNLLIKAILNNNNMVGDVGVVKAEETIRIIKMVGIMVAAAEV